MADITDAIKAILVADSVMTDYLTGGIYTWADTKYIGINRETTPDAFDSTTKLLLPNVVIKTREEGPFGGLHDPAAKTYSVQQVVELWFRDKANTGWATLRLAASYALLLLGDETLSPGGRITWANALEIRLPELGGCDLLRHDYQRIGVKTGV